MPRKSWLATPPPVTPPPPETSRPSPARAAGDGPPRPRDPWTVNDPDDRAVKRARWLLRRKGFLR